MTSRSGLGVTVYSGTRTWVLERVNSTGSRYFSEVIVAEETTPNVKLVGV